MPEATKSKDEPIVIEADESLGTADLEAEIEAQIQASLKKQQTSKAAEASVADEASKPVTKKPTTAKPAKTKTAPKPKTAKKAAPKKPAAQPAEDEDTGEAVQVTVKKRPAAVSPESTDQPPDEKPSGEPAEEVVLVNHSAKKIQPISQTTEEPSEEPAEEATEEPDEQPETEAEAETKAKPETPEPAGDTAHKLDAMSGELKDKTAAKKPAEEEVKIYDTKQYHLPIKPGRHHRQRVVHPAVTVLVFVVLGAGLALLAVDAELLDVGLKLPFDLL